MKKLHLEYLSRKKKHPFFSLSFTNQLSPSKKNYKNKLTYSKIKKKLILNNKKKNKLHTYHSQKQITQTLEIYTEIQSTESRKLWADVFTNFWAGGRIGRRVRSTPETD